MNHAKTTRNRRLAIGSSPEDGPASSHEARRFIDALFPLGGGPSSLTGPDWRRLFSHLRDDRCRWCQDYFEERRTLALGAGADKVLSEHEIDAIVKSIEPAPPEAGPAPSRREPARADRRAHAGWALAAAACAALLLYPLDTHRQRGDELADRKAAVSADLFCVEPPGRAVALAGTQSVCSPDARIAARAVAPPAKRLSHFTVIACEDDFRCRIVSSDIFTEKRDLIVAGPRMTDKEPIRIFVVWSDRAIADDMVLRAGDRARSDRWDPLETAALPLTMGWPQMAFTVYARAEGCKSP